MQRIIGLEHELDAIFYESSGFPANENDNDSIRLLGELFEILKLRGYLTKVPSCGFTRPAIGIPNGGMICQDMGHLEIATPECDDPRLVVVYDKAIDAFLTQTIEAWNRGYPGDRSCRLSLHKKNTGIIPMRQGPIIEDGASTDVNLPSTRAFHENYSISKVAFDSVTSTDTNNDPDSLRGEGKFLSLFFIARYLITGSGGIVCDPNMGTIDNPHFHFAVSPRFFRIRQIVALKTTDSYDERGIINTRKMSLMDELPYERLHVICGDSNMMEKSVWLTVGITSLILELIEHNAWSESLGLKRAPDNVGRFLRDLSLDHAGQTKLELANNASLSVLEILWRYYELCESYVARENITRHAKLLQEWRRVMLALERDWRDLVGVLGWPTLRQIICGESKNPSRLNREKLHQRNFDFHNINARESLYYDLAGEFERVTTDEEVLAAASTPPTTRASLRVLICERLRELGFPLVSMGWDHINFETRVKGASYCVKIPDPLTHELREVENIDVGNRAAIVELGLQQKGESRG